MKKILLFTAAVLSFAACQKSESGVEPSPEKKLITLTATINLPETKVQPDNPDSATVTFHWEPGDSVFVYNSSYDKKVFRIVDSTISGKTASFVGEQLEGMSVVCYGLEIVSAAAGDTIRAVCIDGSFSPIATGNISGTSFNLDTFCPVLRLQLKGTATIGKIRYGIIGLCKGEMVFNGGLPLKSSADTIVYYAVPATNQDGFYIQFYDENDSLLLTKTSSMDLTQKTGKIVTMPSITIDKPVPEGALSGLFTVDSLGTKVRFSKGNLQYLGTGTSGDLTPRWRFAEHQYDIMGDGPSSGTANQGNVDLSSLGYSTYNTGSGTAGPNETSADKQAARDLFGWGTTGNKDTRSNTYENNYQPFSTSFSMQGASQNKCGYGPDYDAGTKYGLSVDNKSDWGCVMGDGHTWRTLSADGIHKGEWIYLLSERVVNGNKGAGYSYEIALQTAVTIEGVTFKGMILFPDEFEKQKTWKTDFTTWAQCDSAGLVFLPAGGYRGSTSSGAVLSDFGSIGYYWSSSVYNATNAYTVYCKNGSINRDYRLRLYGQAVRLVTNAN